MFDPWVGKMAWRRKWQPTPVFLPEKFHGQRIPAGYSPWGHKKSDMTKRLSLKLTEAGDGNSEINILGISELKLECVTLAQMTIISTPVGRNPLEEME